MFDRVSAAYAIHHRVRDVRKRAPGVLAKQGRGAIHRGALGRCLAALHATIEQGNDSSLLAQTRQGIGRPPAICEEKLPRRFWKIASFDYSDPLRSCLAANRPAIHDPKMAGVGWKWRRMSLTLDSGMYLAHLEGRWWHRGSVKIVSVFLRREILCGWLLGGR